MCVAIPVALAIASFAASAAGAVAQAKGQQATADYQDKANKIATEQLGVQADARRMDGERERQQQFEQDASEVNAYEQDAMRQRASVQALIGEYGGGNSAGRRLTTLGMAQGQDLATMQANAKDRQAELGFRESADLTSMRSGVSSLPAVQRPSGSGLALGIAGSALTFKGRERAVNDPFGQLDEEMARRRKAAVYETMPYLQSNRSLGD